MEAGRKKKRFAALANGRRRAFPAPEKRAEAEALFRGSVPWQQAFLFLQGLVLVLFLAMFFYRSLLAALVFLPLVFPIYRRQKRKAREKRRKALVSQFKELMGSLITALKAGYSAENAFAVAYSDMEYLFGGASPICSQLRRVLEGLRNNIPLEELLRAFAAKSDAEEIREFAEVFAIAKRSGGNMIAVMDKTVRFIQSRVEVEKEIDLLLSARKMEQKIMDVVPFFIIAYIGISSEGFFDVLYHNPVGVAVMSGCLVVYVAAYLLSEKIVDIQL